MKNRLIDNVFAGGFSIILHTVLLALIVFGVDFQSTRYIADHPKANIVQATAMDEKDVLAEMARQQQYEDKKRQQEQDRQGAIDQKLQQTKDELKRKKQQMLQQQKQDDLDQQQRKLAAKRKQKEIAKLEQQRQLEDDKRLQAEADRKAAEARQQQAEQDRKVAEERKQQAEQERLIEEARQQQAEQDRKVAEERKQQAEQDRKVAEERKQQAKKDAQRAEADWLLQENLAAEAREQETSRINGVVKQHGDIIKQRTNRYWIKPRSAERGLKCKLQVSLLLPSGEVKQVKIVKSSGNTLFDRSAVTAVYKASPLPMPTDPKAAAEFKQFLFNFEPE